MKRVKCEFWKRSPGPGCDRFLFVRTDNDVARQSVVLYTAMPAGQDFITSQTVRNMQNCSCPRRRPRSGAILSAIAVAIASGCGALQASNSPSQQVVGYIERAKLSERGTVVEAKLDTGATTTSIDAEILDRPEDDSAVGGTIRFRFRDRQGDGQIYERSIVRWVRIKDGDGGFFRRPVVTMRLCVAGRWIEGEVNLADRQQFSYPVLIGRNMLAEGNLVIDSAAENVAGLNCPQENP